MKTEYVFQKAEELERLDSQVRLLAEYETSAYDEVLRGNGLRVLDVGCNNGTKTAYRFDRDNIDTVIGIDCYKENIRTANENYGSGKLHFHCFDVDGIGLEEYLRGLILQYGIEGFDVIHLSFVLMHLKNSLPVLSVLKKFLVKGGRLMTVEADDASCSLVPDREGRFASLLKILSKDPFAGDRAFADKLAPMLCEIGYRIENENRILMQFKAQETKKKSEVFGTLFSYLPNDMELLCENKKGLSVYGADRAWLSCNYPALCDEMLEGDTELTAAIRIFICYDD